MTDHPKSAAGELEPFVAVESGRPILAPAAPEPIWSENPMATAGFVVALIGGGVSFSILFMRLAQSQWVAGNLGVAVGINQLGVIVALMGVVVSSLALFYPLRRLAIAGIVVGVIGAAAIQFRGNAEPANQQIAEKPKEPEKEKPTPPPTPAPAPNPKPMEPVKSPDDDIKSLPEANEPRDAERDWMTLDRKTTRGTFLRLDSDKVLIRLAEGNEASLDFKQLIPRDQRWVIKQLREKVPATANPAGEGYRNFTTKRGFVFACKFVEMRGEDVILEYEDGRLVRIPLAELSEADQQYIAKRK